MADTAQLRARDRALPGPNTVLAMLLAVYVFNFVDRQILAILAAPIQADLGSSQSTNSRCN